MPEVSFGGLGNGIDFGQVITQLVAVRRIPIKRLADTKQSMQTRLDNYGTLGTKLLALQTAASALRTGAGFDKAAVTVGNDAVLTASAASTATPGSYTVEVTQLASAHQVTNKAAKAVASTTTDIVGGGSGTFTFRVGAGPDQTVTLNASATLEDLRTAINDLGAGVSASILNTGTSASPAYRLVLTGANTGAGNGITVVADDTDLDFLNGTGTGGVDTLQAAQDAIIVVGDPAQNPVTLQRSTNVITDAIPGVTLTLKAPSGGNTVALTVARDTGAIKSGVKALVDGYNDVVSFVNRGSTYDVATRKGGVFVGESAARGVLSKIREALSAAVGGLTTYTSVGQVGLTTQRDGTVVLDDAAIDGALSANYTAVKNLFIGQTATTGVAERLYDAVDVLDDVDNGALTVRKEGLTAEIGRLEDTILRREDGLKQYEERLRLQYAALDGLLRRIQSQSAFISQKTG